MRPICRILDDLVEKLSWFTAFLATVCFGAYAIYLIGENIETQMGMLLISIVVLLATVFVFWFTFHIVSFVLWSIRDAF